MLSYWSLPIHTLLMEPECSKSHGFSPCSPWPPCIVTASSNISLLLLLWYSFHPPAHASSSSSSHNMTLLCSCLPVPYFRRSHGFNFYYVLMTHRCTLYLWRFASSRPASVFLLVFFSLISPSVVTRYFKLKSPSHASRVPFLSCLLKRCHLMGSFILKPFWLFLFLWRTSCA